MARGPQYLMPGLGNGLKYAHEMTTAELAERVRLEERFLQGMRWDKPVRAAQEREVTRLRNLLATR